MSKKQPASHYSQIRLLCVLSSHPHGENQHLESDCFVPATDQRLGPPFPTATATKAQSANWDMAYSRGKGRAVAEPPFWQFNQQGRH